MDGLPEAILLDLDDTILDDSGCVDACWSDACAEASARDQTVEALALQAAIKEHADWWWSDPERHIRGRLDLRATTIEIVEEAFRRLGLASLTDPALLANRYRDLREERAMLIEGALSVLDELKNQGVKLGMMTNGAGAAQRAKIERFALAPYFDHIVIEGEFGVGKPDRRVFESLLSALRVDPEKAWAVGDNLEFDVLAPMSMGILGVWVNPSGRQASGKLHPDRVIERLRELI